MAAGRVPPEHADDDDALAPGIRRVDDDGSMFVPPGDDDGPSAEDSRPNAAGGTAPHFADEAATDLDIGLDGTAGGDDEGGAWTDAVGEHEDDALLDGVDEPADGEGWASGTGEALLEDVLDDALGAGEEIAKVLPRGTELEGPDEDPDDVAGVRKRTPGADDFDDDALPPHLARVSERPPASPNLDEDEPFAEDSES